MKARWLVASVAAALGVGLASVACGGVVETKEPAPGPSSVPTTSSPTGTGGGAAGNGTPDNTPTVELPDCVKGFDPASFPGRQCLYQAEGLCYDQKLDACACVCKQTRGTTCSSGFPELSGTTTVSCF